MRDWDLPEQVVRDEKGTDCSSVDGHRDVIGTVPCSKLIRSKHFMESSRQWHIPPGLRTGRNCDCRVVTSNPDPDLLVKTSPLTLKLGTLEHLGDLGRSDRIHQRMDMRRRRMGFDPFRSGCQERFVVGQSGLLEDIIEELRMSVLEYYLVKV